MSVFSKKYPIFVLNMLSTSQLSIGYGTKALLSGLYLLLNKGELVCLIGRNGCGKSTLIRTLAMLQTPQGGEMFIDGKNVRKLPVQQRARLVSVVLTERTDTGMMRTGELVALGRYPHTDLFGKLTAEDGQIIDGALKAVNLADKKQHLVAELSDGERQKAMIARAVAQDAPVIILDEPTSHLDVPNRIEIMSLMRRLAKEMNKAVLLSTHEPDLALQNADRLWLMDKNTVESHPASEWTAEKIKNWLLER
ncbi:MAG: ABC transporter ATP-binding protein [Prevotellaceae bacterium]|nr:ABC transporter ATP-binding protein [Prevotellaceae bacterium]